MAEAGYPLKDGNLPIGGDHVTSAIEKFSHRSELDLELFLVTEVLGLESLHYGYWNSPPQALDLSSVSRAQLTYTETLASLIPEGVKSILDVGCGIGDNAIYLDRMGYEVTAISPDENHVNYFQDDDHQIRFMSTTIQNYNEDKQFDLILMSESQNYFPMDTGMIKARNLLRDGGYLLISGHFSTSDFEQYKMMHNYQDYVKCAEIMGFELQTHQDITKNVIPTLEYTYEVLTTNLQGLLQFVEIYGQRFMPWRTRLAKLFLTGQKKNLRDILDFYEEFVNPENFTKYANYVRLLFRVNKEKAKNPDNR